MISVNANQPKSPASWHLRIGQVWSTAERTGLSGVRHRLASQKLGRIGGRNMTKYLGWIGMAVFGVASLAVGAVPLYGHWPGWVLVAVGMAALAGTILTFPLPTSDGPKPLLGRKNVNQTAGHHSRQVNIGTIDLGGKGGGPGGAGGGGGVFGSGTGGAGGNVSLTVTPADYKPEEA